MGKKSRKSFYIPKNIKYTRKKVKKRITRKKPRLCKLINGKCNWRRSFRPGYEDDLYQRCT